jgi:N-acetylglutamate synthase-like GNAT family acetyltransferase
MEVVTFEAVRHLARRAAADHVSLTETRDTVWYATRSSGLVVATAALMRVGSGMRLKGAWVEPAWRGQGIGAAMVDGRIRIAEDACASFLETLSLHPEFFERRGFARQGAILASGAIRLRRVL